MGSTASPRRRVFVEIGSSSSCDLTRAHSEGTQVTSNTVQIGSGTEAMEVGFARGAYYIDAVLDDAVYYTRALSPAEITQLAAP